MEIPYTQKPDESDSVPRMAGTSEVAKKLKALREEARISVREASRAAELSAGGYQHYEDRFKDQFLPVALINKLVPLFEQRGVESHRLRALAGLELSEPEPPKSNVTAITEAPDVTAWPRDLPVYGTAIGGQEDDADFEFNQGNIIDHVRRPPRLAGVRDAFAIILIGDSMAPQFMPGAPMLIHPTYPPKNGDVVLVELRPAIEGGGHPGLVKRLVTRSDAKVRLAQHNPPRDDIHIPTKRILRVYRVIPYEEILQF